MNTPSPKGIIVKIVHILYVPEKWLVHHTCWTNWYLTGLWGLEKWSIFFLNIIMPFQFVMYGQMMFSKIICYVVDSFILLHEELVLSSTISQPMILHIPAFWSFDLHLGMNKAVGCRIISDNFCIFMWMPHTYECILDTALQQLWNKPPHSTWLQTKWHLKMGVLFMD